MENINYKIYKLLDPESSMIRYIGLTFNSLKHRLQSHCSERGKSHKISWIKSLQNKNLRPIIEEIESGIASYELACEREIFWISKHFEDGHSLTNSNNGGNKNKKMNTEVRIKMSISRKKWLSENKVEISEKTRQKISEGAKKRFEDPTEKERLRISNKKYEDSKTEKQKLEDILKQDCKGVCQFDKNLNLLNEFPSVRDAERKTGIHRSNITKCCKLKVKSAGGFIWKYKNNI